MGPYSGKRAVEKCEYIFARLGGMKRRVYIERNDESGLKIASALARKNADGMRRIARVNAAFAKRFLD